MRIDHSVASPDFRNTLLRHLPPETVTRLQLSRVKLPALREIEYPGNEIGNIFFLEDGVASTTASFRDGSEVEIGVAGYESVLGTSVFLGTKRSLNRVYMQIEGWGFMSRTSVALLEFKKHEVFHELVLRYTQAQFIQSSQTAGCNARHDLQQRLARWLLLCADRMQGNSPMPLAQEFIAQMLGNRRTSVSVEAGKLQERGLIRYTRGKLSILDRAGLERVACECYEVVREHLQNYADSEQGFGT